MIITHSHVRRLIVNRTLFQPRKQSFSICLVYFFHFSGVLNTFSLSWSFFFSQTLFSLHEERWIDLFLLGWPRSFVLRSMMIFKEWEAFANVPKPKSCLLLWKWPRLKSQYQRLICKSKLVHSMASTQHFSYRIKLLIYKFPSFNELTNIVNFLTQFVYNNINTLP